MISIRKKAEEDLLNIWKYIACDDSQQADHFLDLIYQKLENLSHTPMMGRARPELHSSMRSFPIGRYIVFYAITNTGIDVVRMLHGSLDIESIFHGH